MTNLPDNILEIVNNDSKNTLMETLGIEFTRLEKDNVTATMPVDKRTMQRFGILHGGASVALAETVASVGGWLNVDNTKKGIVGLEINANHLKKTTGGLVEAIATPIRIGRKVHVWDIKLYNDKKDLVCISRCTLAVVEKFEHPKV